MNEPEPNETAEAQPEEKQTRFRDRLIAAFREKTREELILSAFVFVVTLLLFGPVLQWMARQTLVHEQLKHAFIVLGMAGYGLLMPRRYRVPVMLAFGSDSLLQLTLAFLILGASLAFSFTPGILVGTLLALSAWILFFFGPSVKRATNILLAVFAGYVFFLVTMPWLDWPLRALAGSQAAWALHLLGYQTSLSLAHPENPLLVLLVNGRMFEVAAECNGFGMISSCVLLALLLVACTRRSFPAKAASLLVAAVLGAMANTLRIVLICILAPHVGEHYHFMHETVGIIFFWGILVLIWLLLKGPRQVREAEPAVENGRLTARTS